MFTIDVQGNIVNILVVIKSKRNALDLSWITQKIKEAS